MDYDELRRTVKHLRSTVKELELKLLVAERRCKQAEEDKKLAEEHISRVNARNEELVADLMAKACSGSRGLDGDTGSSSDLVDRTQIEGMSSVEDRSQAESTRHLEKVCPNTLHIDPLAIVEEPEAPSPELIAQLARKAEEAQGQMKNVSHEVHGSADVPPTVGEQGSQCWGIDDQLLVEMEEREAKEIGADEHNSETFGLQPGAASSSGHSMSDLSQKVAAPLTVVKLQLKMQRMLSDHFESTHGPFDALHSGIQHIKHVPAAMTFSLKNKFTQVCGFHGDLMVPFLEWVNAEANRAKHPLQRDLPGTSRSLPPPRSRQRSRPPASQLSNSISFAAQPFPTNDGMSPQCTETSAAVQHWPKDDTHESLSVDDVIEKYPLTAECFCVALTLLYTPLANMGGLRLKQCIEEQVGILLPVEPKRGSALATVGCWDETGVQKILNYYGSQCKPFALHWPSYVSIADVIWPREPLSEFHKMLPEEFCVNLHPLDPEQHSDDIWNEVQESAGVSLPTSPHKLPGKGWAIVACRSKADRAKVLAHYRPGGSSFSTRPTARPYRLPNSVSQGGQGISSCDSQEMPWHFAIHASDAEAVQWILDFLDEQGGFAKTNCLAPLYHKYPELTHLIGKGQLRQFCENHIELQYQPPNNRCDHGIICRSDMHMDVILGIEIPADIAFLRYIRSFSEEWIKDSIMCQKWQAFHRADKSVYVALRNNALHEAYLERRSQIIHLEYRLTALGLTATESESAS